MFDSVKGNFDPSVSVGLDLGCGSGRNFCFVRNIRKLVAIDISAGLLEEARNPRRSDLISIEEIELVQSDLLLFEKWGTGHDLIYSIGVLSFVLPIDEAILGQVHKRLKDEGIFVIAYLISRDSWLKRRLRILLRSLQFLVARGTKRPSADHALRIAKFMVGSEKKATRLFEHVGFQVLRSYNHPTKDWKVVVLQKSVAK